ncbi:MAG: hypothetical protein C0410_13410, partial [Anaerolinea sp.]|nr:hypothetical protein [Anaerolinea sp.]
ALLVDTTITMTPVATLTGLPFGSADSLAVQLEPEGLSFNNFVTLTITPKEMIPVDQQLMFTYQGAGQDVILAFPVVDSKEIKMQLLHFSGYGVTKGLLADIEPARNRIGGTAERRIQSAAAERLGRERQSQLLGSEDSSEGLKDLADLFQQYEDEVVKPRIAAAGESCAAGQLALQTVLGFERQKQLLGMESNGMQDVVDLMDVVGLVCVKEEYEMCKNDHVIHRMIAVWLGMERQSQLLGGGVATEAIKLAKDLTQKCLSFELVFSSTGTFDAGDGEGYSSTVTSTVKMQFNADVVRIAGEAPLVNSDFVYRMNDCSVTSDRGGGSFNAMDMGYTIQENIPPGQVGKVTDIDLVYYPGNTSESFTVKCEDSPPYTAPPSPLWTGVYLVTHQFEMDQAKGGFTMQDWEVLGNEYFAKKEWTTEYPDVGLIEVGTFKLYHRPK